MNDALLKITNLKKKFGDFIAVDGISFSINEGEIFGFLGPNGAGKTTTINMICGLLKPDSGEIIFSSNLSNKTKIKTQIGICPQENIIWPKLTCFEQLIFMGEMYGLPRNKAIIRSKQCLEWMGLKAKSNIHASKLSGGMKRRLNICLALIHDPKILVLDEPEAGLDPQSRILVREFIKSLSAEKTIILTTHNMDEADRLSDRVAIIDHGKLLLVDTPENLKESIGEGDVLEVQLENDNTKEVKSLIHTISNLYDKVYLSGNSVIIKSKNLINSIVEITAKFKEQNVKIAKITMRENTLEDVFIYLTGRKLRE
jgi:ABC-2 type transport system ATP-binding protein